MAKELVPGALDGRKQVYFCSPVMKVSEEDARAYDDTREPMEKKLLTIKLEFYIISRSIIE